jgi:hypothetical protein
MRPTLVFFKYNGCQYVPDLMLVPASEKQDFAFDTFRVYISYGMQFHQPELLIFKDAVFTGPTKLG